jgi:ATP adenylyltransferase/5',5'''-P-1,P-4-tetraphosphate phosphorylase II
MHIQVVIWELQMQIMYTCINKLIVTLNTLYSNETKSSGMLGTLLFYSWILVVPRSQCVKDSSLFIPGHTKQAQYTM